MQRREFISLLGGATVAWPALGHAQNSTKRLEIAMLISGSAAGVSRNVIGFRQRLQQLGYVEGRDLDIVDRYADDNVARLPALAEELVRQKPDIIVTTSPDGALAAMRVTATIPIVSAVLADPVSQGLITSHARPGGNVTGILFTPGGLTGKQMELARELTPGAATFGVLLDVSNPSNLAQRDDAEMAAATLRVRLVPIAISTRDAIKTAFQKLVGERANWVLVSGSSLFFSERQRIAALAIAARLPSIYPFREHVEAGGLISYGVNQLASHRRAADYVDMIVKGAKPNEMPLEFPTTHISAINLKTARAISLTIPEAFLLQADEMIE